MIDIAKPVLKKISIALRLQVRCIYTATNDLANNINMMLLQTQEFKLFEEQKALLYQCIMELERSADARIF